MPQRFAAALGHDFDGQATVEVGCALPFLEGRRLARQQSIHEGIVPRLVERAVDVVEPVAAGSDLVVARLEPGLVEIDAVPIDDRRDRIEEGQMLLAGQRRDGARQTRRGQRTRGQDDVGPVAGRQAVHDLAAQFDPRFGRDGRRHGCGESVPVHG